MLKQMTEEEAWAEFEKTRETGGKEEGEGELNDCWETLTPEEVFGEEGGLQSWGDFLNYLRAEEEE